MKPRNKKVKSITQAISQQHNMTYAQKTVNYGNDKLQEQAKTTLCVGNDEYECENRGGLQA